jgi:ribosomal protein L35AE/L33A
LETTQATLVEHRAVRERQEAARRERQQTIIYIYQNIGSVTGGKVFGAYGKSGSQ